MINGISFEERQKTGIRRLTGRAQTTGSWDKTLKRLTSGPGLYTEALPFEGWIYFERLIRRKSGTTIRS